MDGQDRDSFRAAFETSTDEPGYPWYFDFDGDGRDNGQFNRRYGQH